MKLPSFGWRPLKSKSLLWAVAILGAPAAYYLLFYAPARERILTERNLRVLTRLSETLDGWLGAQERAFLTNVQSPVERTPDVQWQGKLRFCDAIERATTRPPTRSAERLEPARLVGFTKDGMTVEFRSTHGASVRCTLPSEYLEPGIQSSIFQLVFLATRPGEVIATSKNASVRLRDLKALPDLATLSGPLIDATRVQTVTLNREGYTLFLQPCCAGLLIGEGQGATRGLVLGALVPSQRLSSEARAVPYTTLLLLCALFIVFFLVLPFLRFMGLGAHAIVRRRHAFLLVLAGLVLVSFVTAAGLDVYAYTALRWGVDRQLKALSVALEEQVDAEVARAYRQLRELDRARADRGIEPNSLNPDLRPRRSSAPIPALARPTYYPPFTFYSVLSDTGRQALKWGSPHQKLTPPISVDDREYFKRTRDGRTWSLPSELQRVSDATRRGFLLEPVVSRTFGESSTVLALPTGNSEFPVITLSLRMLSLLNPVLPPGFAFAVIDDRSTVLFHSEPELHLDENFFVEAKLDRSLRAATAARRSKSLDLAYFGRDVRAHIRPLKNFPEWSVVTMADSQLRRGVNVDILGTTLLFTLLYSSILLLSWILRGAWGRLRGTLASPLESPTWLWPHPGRATAYRWIAAWLVLEAGLLLLLGYAYREEHTSLLWAALAAPIVGYGVARLALNRQPRAIATMDAPVPRSYTVLLVALLMLIAAAPSVIFFHVGHALHLEALVKYTQLTLAQGMVSPPSRARAPVSGPSAADGIGLGPAWAEVNHSGEESGEGCLSVFGVYHCGLFGTTATMPAWVDRDAVDPTCVRLPDDVQGFVADYLPYYSDYGVHMRELLHHEASDAGWQWRRCGRTALRFYKPNRSGHLDLQLESHIPTLLGQSERGVRLAALLALLLVAIVAPLAVAVVVARAIAKWVFVTDVRRWRSASGLDWMRMPPTRNLFVLTPSDEARTVYREAPGLHQEDVAVLANSGKWDETLLRITRLPAGQGVLLDHFEQAAGNRVLADQTLRFLEEVVRRGRTVVVLSAVSAEAFAGESALAGGEATSPESPRAEPTTEWRTLLSDFRVVHAEPVRARGAFRGAASERAAGDASGNGEPTDERSPGQGAISPRQARLLQVTDEECGDDEHLRPIRDEIAARIVGVWPEGYGRKAILQEIATRARPYYRARWETCSKSDKLALYGLAAEGLVNYKNDESLVRLVSCALVRRDPRARVFNRTFRSFVLGAECRREVLAIEKAERERAPSTWDEWRVAVWVGATIGLLLFLTTQAERLERMVPVITSLTSPTGVLGALSAGVLSLTKLASWLKELVEGPGADKP